MDFTVIAIGDELLKGYTVDTNSAWIARVLTDRGHSIRRIVVVGDSSEEIVEELNRMRRISDWVIVTGGLGTTPDDITREAVARALGKDLMENDEARRSVKRRYRVDDRVIRKVTFLPDGAEVIENDVGMAPGFIVDNVIVMPGVPEEMKNIFEKVVKRFGREQYAVETIETERREAEITPVLEKIVKKYPDISIGSYPGRSDDGRWRVVLRITGRNVDMVKEVKNQLERDLGML